MSAGSSSGKMGFWSQQWKESEKMSLGTGATVLNSLEGKEALQKMGEG